MRRAVWGVVLAVWAVAASAAEWQVDYARSRLGFVGSQQGGSFEGEFGQWRARIRFDPERLQHSEFDVVVDPTSARTGSPERDSQLPGEAWFHASRFPAAIFRTRGFRSLGGGNYIADGELTIRGVSRALALPFRWTGSGADGELHAEAMLNRLHYGIGEGEFADSDVVGYEVRVVANLLLRRQ